MDIIKAFAVNNPCYKAGTPMNPVGILVHSTGANNPYLKRYVDAPAEVGVNKYNNTWNTANTTVLVHAFIGYDKTMTFVLHSVYRITKRVGVVALVRMVLTIVTPLGIFSLKSVKMGLTTNFISKSVGGLRLNTVLNCARSTGLTR